MKHIVHVCWECHASGEASAPRSCVTCKVATCEHIADVGDHSLFNASPCSLHGVVKDFSPTLELDDGE